MLKVYKKAFYALIVSLIPVLCSGQNSSSSPYSMFGIGDMANIGFGRNHSMGGVSSPLVSGFNLNPANPASYVGLFPNSFVFEVGVNLNSYSLKTPEEKYTKFDGNIAYIAAGFSITKWWKAGMGLKPISNIGYQITDIQDIESANTLTRNTYEGNGGINSFYLDNSFQLFKPLSVGVKVAYTFGSLDRIILTRTFNIINDTTIANISDLTQTNHAVFDAVSLGFGLHFHKAFGENYFLNIGAIYNLKTELKGQEDRLITRVFNDTRYVGLDTLLNETINSGSIDLPQNYAIGASVLFKQKLELAFDYQVDKWSKSKFYGETQDFYDNQRFCFGLEYTPDFSSTKYLNLIRFRAGFSQVNSYLKINDKQMKQTGFSFGLGLPLKSATLINLSVQYNSRNIPDDNYLKENYWQFHINFSFRSSWFYKYKYD